MKNTPSGRWTTRWQKYKKFLWTGALLVSLFASPDVMAQWKPLYTQASQWWICVTKQEFKRWCGLHNIPQSQIDSVRVGENLDTHLGYRISTDKWWSPKDTIGWNVFYRIDTKRPISHNRWVPQNSNNDISLKGELTTPKPVGSPHDNWIVPNANGDSNIWKETPIIIWGDDIQVSDNSWAQWETIKPIIPPNVTPELRNDIEKFFWEFSTAQADYYYTWPTFTLELQNEELLEMTRWQIKEIPITQNEEVNNCSDYCILRMWGKVVGVADKDENMVDIVDMVLDSNGEIEWLYKMICEYKAELWESYGTMDEEMKALFAKIWDYVSSHPPYKREINSKEEFLKKNPQDCFEDVLLQSLHNEMSWNTGESSWDVNVKYGN